MKHKRLAALLSLLLALLLVPSRAYADARFGFVGLLDGVQYHNNYSDDGTDGNENYLVWAPDKYAAAVIAVGGDVNSLTAEQKLKLSDSNHGGAFYSYAQGFSELTGSTSPDFPDWVPTYVCAALLVYWTPVGDAATSLDPDGEMYESSVSSETYDAAKAAYLAVINGEDTGGSGGPVQDDDYYVFSGNYHYGSQGIRDGVSVGGVTYTANPNHFNYTGFAPMQSPVTIKIKKSALSYLNRFYPYDEYPWYVRFSYGSGKAAAVWVMAGVNTSPVMATQDVPVIGSNEYISSVTYSSGRCLYFGRSGWTFPNPTTFVYDGTTYLREVNLNFDFNAPGEYVIASSFTSAPPPSGNWPEDEPTVTPTAPVVPDPDSEPVVTEPVVVAPTVTFPDIDITVTDNSPEGTTPEDYTPWLRAINENLNSLRSDLLVEFDAIKTSIRNIYTYLQHLDDLLENHCVHLRNQIITSTNHLESYLQGLFTWLGEQLSFSFDDTNIVIWLKRIYSRLGGSNTFQPDPISDDDGFLDWLYQLWQNFLIDLLSVLPDSLGGLVETISQLTHYFPFSIPWDLFALLALFEHEPVIPVFDIPYPYSPSEGGQVMLHIDLTDWDPVAQMVRPVFVVGFCMQLALITKDLLSSLDMSKGGI